MRILAELAARVAELERRLAGVVTHGTVAEVDAAKGRVRLKHGAATEGGDMLSPWVPYSQVGGALKVHSPPSVGQQFSLISPAGDPQQGFAVPLAFTDKNASPSTAGNENVVTFGDATIKLTGGGLEISVGGVSLRITGSGVEISGGRVEHDGRNIGASHVHPGVYPGVAKTQPPDA